MIIPFRILKRLQSLLEASEGKLEYHLGKENNKMPFKMKSTSNSSIDFSCYLDIKSAHVVVTILRDGRVNVDVHYSENVGEDCIIYEEVYTRIGSNIEKFIIILAKQEYVTVNIHDDVVNYYMGIIPLDNIFSKLGSLGETEISFKILKNFNKGARQ